MKNESWTPTEPSNEIRSTEWEVSPQISQVEPTDEYQISSETILDNYSELVHEFTMQTNPEGYQNTIDTITNLNEKVAKAKERLAILESQVDFPQIYRLRTDLEQQEKILNSSGFRPLEKLKAVFAIKRLSREANSAIGEVSLPAVSAEERYWQPYKNVEHFTSGAIERAAREISEELQSDQNTLDYTPIQINELLEQFLRKEMSRYCEQDFTMEEMYEAMSEENLAKLSIGDYLATLGKFPGNVLTHVTRQGIRDHTDMMWHTAGKGENHDGFKGILKRGKLLTTVETAKERGLSLPDALGASAPKYKLPDIDKETEHSMRIRQEMLYNLRQTMENPNRERSSINGHFGYLFDKMSVHFGVSKVLDDFYGSEHGNECFLVFPQAMATQTEYKGTLFQWKPHTAHNDVGLLPKDGEGFSIEASLIFIPKNAQVDRETGSKYKIVDGKPVVVGEDIDKYGESTPRYALAENPISSEDYWEDFIKTNCEGLNLKVVYYDTKLSPTRAVYDFLASNGLNKEMSEGQPIDPIERKKYRQLEEAELKRQSDFITRDMAVKAHMTRLIDEAAITKAINDHFDKIERDPKGIDLLQRRIDLLKREDSDSDIFVTEDGRITLKKPIESMAENHARRLKKSINTKSD